MIPDLGTPAGEGWNAATHWSVARMTLKRLRIELHAHQIFPALSYTGGMPHLVVSPELTAWADRDATVINWSGGYNQEPLGHTAAGDLSEAARQLAALAGKDCAEPVTAP